MRNDVRGIGAEQSKDRLEEDDGGDAVDVVVAVNQDRFVVANGALDSFARRSDAVNSGRIVQVIDARRNEAAIVVVGVDAAALKNRRDDRMNRKAVPVRLL